MFEYIDYNGISEKAAKVDAFINLHKLILKPADAPKAADGL